MENNNATHENCVVVVVFCFLVTFFSFIHASSFRVFTYWHLHACAWANACEHNQSNARKSRAKEGFEEMPSRTAARESRSDSRGRRQTPSPPVANGRMSAGDACLAEEALAVEAILAGRPSTASCRSSPWGMWAAVVALEVVAFVWLKWAMDTYGVYSAARS
ncbi:uncharacterized protein Tco025E_06995 [Trypanosoma conorhini]|uniref:Uncharacterized protein n=1 Tax=Trypanosoma conorhini TaxID=83891 RepID=A0A3R7KKY3_9TRYP|nr:uncharacterized protein Tco025E_06995 [Trypanosoma conorhini]RNF09556.1 hypothetical protein Tco025E_06995 [Trypanosoma conorhini]